jgi:hypothetical protein
MEAGEWERSCPGSILRRCLQEFRKQEFQPYLILQPVESGGLPGHSLKLRGALKSQLSTCARKKMQSASDVRWEKCRPAPLHALRGDASGRATYFELQVCD